MELKKAELEVKEFIKRISEHREKMGNVQGEKKKEDNILQDYCPQTLMDPRLKLN